MADRGKYKKCSEPDCPTFLWEVHSASKEKHICNSCFMHTEPPFDLNQVRMNFKYRLRDLEERGTGA
jgi:hypothetical protein